MSQIPQSNPAAELAGVEVNGMTRSAFIVRGALAAGAVYGASTVGPFVRQALAQSDMGDVEIVSFALTLEYLETEFYTEALKGNLSADTKELANLIRRDEAEHVSALSATLTELKATSVKKPTFMFPKGDEAAFLKLAQTLEDTGVSAYNGAGPMIKSKEVLGAAGSIVQVEARHAAAIRLLNEQPPAPDAFDKPLAEAAVLKAVKPFIKA